MARAKKIPQQQVDDFVPDAMVIRTCAADGTSYGGFRWPMEVGARVEAPDWNPTPKCGHGLHGLLDGLGDWTLIYNDAGRVWQVIGVVRAEVVVIDNRKVKFPRGRVIYSGCHAGALAIIRPAMVAAIRGSVAATTCDGSVAATTGDGSAAATTGDGSAAATTGDGSAAATTGDGSIAAALGAGSTASAGPGSWIVLAAWDGAGALVAVRAAQIGGPEGLRPHVAYRLTTAGEFVESGAAP